MRSDSDHSRHETSRTLVSHDPIRRPQPPMKELYHQTRMHEGANSTDPRALQFRILIVNALVKWTIYELKSHHYRMNCSKTEKRGRKWKKIWLASQHSLHSLHNNLRLLIIAQPSNKLHENMCINGPALVRHSLLKQGAHHLNWTIHRVQ